MPYLLIAGIKRPHTTHPRLHCMADASPESLGYYHLLLAYTLRYYYDTGFLLVVIITVLPLFIYLSINQAPVRPSG